MKNIIILLILIASSAPALSLGGYPAASAKNIDLIIEDYEDGDYTKAPEWWTFGNASFSIATSPAKDKAALSIKGTARDWYVGGMGLYFGDPTKDYSKYSRLEVDIYGTGTKSGMIKIELYDDDNGSKHIEKDPSKGYAPIFDDRFVYEQKITWDGWKHLSIPFSEFVDNNTEAGDNVWNPNRTKSSGGLLEMQFIAIAASKTGKVDFIIDNIGFNGGNKL